MASPHHVLTHLIESELRKDDLLKVADPERVRNIAENLARKLLAGRAVEAQARQEALGRLVNDRRSWVIRKSGDEFRNL